MSDRTPDARMTYAEYQADPSAAWEIAQSGRGVAVVMPSGGTMYLGGCVDVPGSWDEEELRASLAAERQAHEATRAKLDAEANLRKEWYGVATDADQRAEMWKNFANREAAHATAIREMWATLEAEHIAAYVEVEKERDAAQAEARGLRAALANVREAVTAELDRGYVLGHEPNAGALWRGRWNLVLARVESALGSAPAPAHPIWATLAAAPRRPATPEEERSIEAMLGDPSSRVVVDAPELVCPRCDTVVQIEGGAPTCPECGWQPAGIEDHDDGTGAAKEGE